MGVIEKALDLVRTMTRGGKSRLLAVMAGDPDLQFPGISLTPGVCGGAPRVSGTRIPVWLLYSLRQDGSTDEQLVAAYPQLSALQLSQAWAFAEQNRELIREEIEQNEAA